MTDVKDAEQRIEQLKKLKEDLIEDRRIYLEKVREIDNVLGQFSDNEKKRGRPRGKRSGQTQANISREILKNMSKNGVINTSDFVKKAKDKGIKYPHAILQSLAKSKEIKLPGNRTIEVIEIKE